MKEHSWSVRRVGSGTTLERQRERGLLFTRNLPARAGIACFRKSVHPSKIDRHLCVSDTHHCYFPLLIHIVIIDVVGVSVVLGLVVEVLFLIIW